MVFDAGQLAEMEEHFNKKYYLFSKQTFVVVGAVLTFLGIGGGATVIWKAYEMGEKAAQKVLDEHIASKTANEIKEYRKKAEDEFTQIEKFRADAKKGKLSTSELLIVDDKGVAYASFHRNSRGGGELSIKNPEGKDVIVLQGSLEQTGGSLCRALV